MASKAGGYAPKVPSKYRTPSKSKHKTTGKSPSVTTFTMGGKTFTGVDKTARFKQTGQKAKTAIDNSAPTGGSLVYNANTGTVTPNNPSSNDPYIKNANKVRNDYYKAYDAQYKQLLRNRNYANENTNNTYNGLARSIYNSYMQNAKNRRQLASNTGMTGGAVENLNVTNENNLNTNYGTSEGLRARALADNEANFNTNVANAKNEYDMNVANLYREARDASLAAKNAERERQYQSYINTVSGFDTVANVNKEIKRLKKSKDPFKQEKIYYLRAQKAAIKAAEK